MPIEMYMKKAGSKGYTSKSKPKKKKVSAVGIGKSIYDDYKLGVNSITNSLTKKAKDIMGKKSGGKVSQYYKDGGEVMTGREGLTAAQKTLPDFLQKKILQAKKKK